MRAFQLGGIDGVRYEPDEPCGTGVLVLAGSSGRVDAPRARLLAREGAITESVRWFGGPGQHDGPWEIPLETFLDRVAVLRRDCARVVIVGTSFGAEAALAAAALAERIGTTVDGVAAFSPTDVVWAGATGEGRTTSHWTLAGTPLPFVPFDEDWMPDADPPAYDGLYAASRLRYDDRVAAATIPVEHIADLLLVAGGDDRVWPALAATEAIAGRRASYGLATVVVTDPEAGHRTVLPGEPVVAGGVRMRRGGSEGADRRLGRSAWPSLLRLLTSR